MAKTKEDEKTPFGTLIDDLGLTYALVAGELEVTPPYVSMLARGEAAPGLAQSLQIDDWAKMRRRRCEPVTWRPTLERLGKRREAARRRA